MPVLDTGTGQKIAPGFKPLDGGLMQSILHNLHRISKPRKIPIGHGPGLLDHVFRIRRKPIGVEVVLVACIGRTNEFGWRRSQRFDERGLAATIDSRCLTGGERDRFDLRPCCHSRWFYPDFAAEDVRFGFAPITHFHAKLGSQIDDLRRRRFDGEADGPLGHRGHEFTASECDFVVSLERPVGRTGDQQRGSTLESHSCHAREQMQRLVEQHCGRRVGCRRLGSVCPSRPWQ
jgi:hypothetical protein